MSGKGDSPRPVDPKRYGENYDRIFQKGVKTLEDFKDEEGFETDPLSIMERLLGLPTKKP